ncbi:MAG: hypothetical protein KBD66_00965 [Candidatus Doudnabacteria bacterium]|nr:hypothetical protein [Candidatus Doudnabacteria bacterium]
MNIWQQVRAALLGKIVMHENNSVAPVPLVITAQVDAVEKHPNADRLRVVSLSDGVRTYYPVVCGAYNFSVGDIVALALPGATIPRNIHSDTHEAFVLSRAIIRGVESRGMICSAFELGLRETPETREEGILIFPQHTPLAVDVFQI